MGHDRLRPPRQDWQSDEAVEDPISAMYTDSISAGSTAGVYLDAIIPHLEDPGDRLANYTVTINDGTLTILNPLPVLTQLSSSVAVLQAPNGAGLQLTLTGSNFVPQSIAQWNGAPLSTRFVSKTQLMATIPASLLGQRGVAFVSVSSPALPALTPGGGGSSRSLPIVLVDVPTSLTGIADAQNQNNGTLAIGGTGAGTPGSLTVQWQGTGTVTIAQFASNPGAGFGYTPPPTPGFFDVFAPQTSSLTSLTITNCSPGANIDYWFDGKSWNFASSQTYNPATGCTTILINGQTSPTLAQLTGTYFGASTDFTAPTVTASGNLNSASSAAYSFGSWTNQSVLVNLSAADNPGGSGVQTLSYSASGADVVPETTVNSPSASLNITGSGLTTISFSARDRAGNASKLQSALVRIDTAPPVITLAASPAVLWPPNHKTVNVQLSGSMTALSGVASASYQVTDSEGTDEPSGVITVNPDGSYQATVPLLASRSGTDSDGRVYTITITARSNAGNTSTSSAAVVVPHDRGH